MEVVEVVVMEAMVAAEVMVEEEGMVEIMEAVEEVEEWVVPCHSSRWSRS